MLRELIDLIPFGWMEFICISLLTITTLSAAFLSRRLFPTSQEQECIERSNSVIAILSAGFSVLLAFIIITTWNYLLKAQDNAAQEANSLAIMMINTEVFPENFKIKFSNAIRNYTVAVRVDEWQTMQNGKESPNAVHAMAELYRVIQSFTPTTKMEQVYYVDELRNLNNARKLRRDRITHLNSVIPGRLSSALIFGSIVLTLIVGAMRGKSKFIDLVPIIIFAGVLGFNLAIALSFDFPFSGDISVRNDFFYHGILKTIKD